VAVGATPVRRMAPVRPVNNDDQAGGYRKCTETF
jgi:hypothetical protein